MRSKEIVASIVVVATVATIALLNTAGPEGQNFLKQQDRYSNAFNHYINKFGKRYGTKEEYEYRLKIFIENYHIVMDHNTMNNGDEAWFTLTQFADMSNQEYQKRLGLIPPEGGFKHTATQHYGENMAKPPKAIDWRDKGVVNAVKDQANCGSCWAFSVVAAIETAQANKNKKLYSLSEQQFVDCDNIDQGCNGGWLTDAFSWAIDNNIDIEEEADYKYVGKDEKCKYDKSKGKVNVKGYHNVTANDSDALKAAVAENVVSVAVNAGSLGWQLYGGGVLKNFCGTNLDHGVAVVGYAEGYWIVRNSWGSGWGENGYVRIYKEDGQKTAGVCGILEAPSYPDV